VPRPPSPLLAYRYYFCHRTREKEKETGKRKYYIETRKLNALALGAEIIMAAEVPVLYIKE
jgi:hypothetical protein